MFAWLKANLGLITAGIALGLFAIEGTRIVEHQAGFVDFGQSAQSIAQIFVPDAHKVFGRSNVRVLVVGLDYDYDNNDNETSKNSRSDIIMALNLDLVNHRVSELSVPRDMVATLPNGQRAKINQAQSDGGIHESEQVVSQWLGIPGFDRHIILRIDTAKDLVNAIGGIDINVQNSNALRGQGLNGPIDYDDNWGHLHVHLKPGLQHLDGDEAVGYARFRHDWCSDPCRIMRQQQVLRAVADKVTHNQWNTISHVQQLVGVVRKDIDTNFTGPEEFSAAMAFSHVKPADIQTAQVPYVDDIVLPDYGDALVPDEAVKHKLVVSLFMGGADATPIRVHVENGTAVAGLASRVADRLRKKGFVITDVSDAPSSDFATTQIQSMSTDTAASAQRVKEALGNSAATASVVDASSTTSDGTSDVTLVLGRDILSAKP